MLNKFVDFIVKNRYVILFVAVVVLLVWTGVIKALIEIIVTLFLVLLAIYAGKKIQEDGSYFKKIFGKVKDYKYEYKVKDNDEEKKEKE